MKRISFAVLFALFSVVSAKAQSGDVKASDYIYPENVVVDDSVEEFVEEFSEFEKNFWLKAWTEEALKPVVTKAIKGQDKATQKTLKAKKDEIAGHLCAEIYPGLVTKLSTLLYGALEVANLHKINAFLITSQGQNYVYKELQARSIYIDDLNQYSRVDPDRRAQQDEFRISPYGENLNVVLILWERVRQQFLDSEEGKAAVVAAFEKFAK